MRKVVGISQKIKRAWLDAVLDRLVTTPDQTELRKFLDVHLKEELPGRTSRAKSAGIILRIWSGIPPERAALRERAVALLPRIPGQDRVWLHWGMTALAYPFFRETAEVVGRLLALQDDFTTAQVQDRMLTTWGDRATSKEAAQKLITTLVDWEVLRSTKTKGHFLLARKTMASIPELQLWLLEALLAASASDEIEAQQLLRLPEAFPFAIGVGVADLRRHEGFNIHRQGLDMDMVALRKLKANLPMKPTKKLKAQIAPRRENRNQFDTGSGDRASGIRKPVDANTLPPAATIQEELRGPYADAIIECAELCRSGHYFGCIALAGAVLDRAVRHVWQLEFKKEAQHTNGVVDSVIALHREQLVGDDWKREFDEAWAQRVSSDYLCKSLELNQPELKKAAKRFLHLLKSFEQEFFGVTTQDGVIVPKHPQYWTVKDGGPWARTPEIH